jgi:hypothetical protein
MLRSITNERLAWGLTELSALTGLSLGLLRREIGRGALRVRRVGRRIIVLDEDWRNYLHQNDPPNGLATPANHLPESE